MISHTCLSCGVTFLRSNSGARYCSRRCYADAVLVGRTVSESTKEKMRAARLANNPMKGSKHTAAALAKMSAAASRQGRGTDAVNWQGGRIIGRYGYVLIYSPGHPNAVGNYVLEHRLVMSNVLGRAIRRDEVVHHKNRVITDNRPENLEVLTRAEHSRFHRLNPATPPRHRKSHVPTQTQ